MTLPTFLGIGTQKCGSTWLYRLLASHPDIYMHPRRKAIAFFSHNYKYGIKWYEKFFPSEEKAARFKSIGEFTPNYLFNDQCPKRIAKIPSITKLIVILRSPVERTLSEYRQWVKARNYSGSMETFLSDYPHAIQYGFYSQYLKNYLHHFRRDQILVLIFEDTITNISQTKDKLANFLGVSSDRFPTDAGSKTVNKSYIPKHRLAWSLIGDLSRSLRHKWNLGWIADWYCYVGRKLNLKPLLFGNAGSFPLIEEKMRKDLGKLYENEIRELESLLKMDLNCWKQLTAAQN